MRKRVAALVVAISLGVLPAMAAQMSAKDPPDASGELSEPGVDCDKKVRMRRDRVAAVGWTCLYVYFVGPGESDPTRDYMVAWHQTTVDGRNGFCTTAIKNDVTRSYSDSAFEGRVPEQTDVGARQDARIELEVEAGESLSQPTTVGQDLVLIPSSYTPSLKNTADGERFRVLWRGKTKKKVAVVSGAELSFDSALPSVGLASSLKFGIERC